MAVSFCPKLASATSAAPAGTSAAATLAGDCPQVRFIWKPTAAGDLCQVRWGKGSQTAQTSDMAVAEGGPECFTKGDATDLAVIGTGTLYIVCGHGD